MKQKNKIIKQYTKPNLLVLWGCIAYLILLSGGFIALSNKGKIVDNHEKIATTFIGIPAVFVSLFGLISIPSAKKDAKKFLATALRVYAVNSYNSGHEEFSNVLETLFDDKACEYVSDFIANRLPKDKIKEISDIISETTRAFEPLSSNKAYNKICNILQNYADNDQTFITDLRVAIAEADRNVPKKIPQTLTRQYNG